MEEQEVVEPKRKMRKLSKIKNQGDFRAGGSKNTKSWHRKLVKGGKLEDLFKDMIANGDLSAEDVNQFSEALYKKQKLEFEESQTNQPDSLSDTIED